MVTAMKVLLVEDDPSMQTALKRTLQNRGMEVSFAATAASRWSAGRRAPPDVVMLDLTLPGMDGLLVLESAGAAAWRPPC